MPASVLPLLCRSLYLRLTPTLHTDLWVLAVWLTLLAAGRALPDVESLCILKLLLIFAVVVAC